MQKHYQLLVVAIVVLFFGIGAVTAVVLRISPLPSSTPFPTPDYSYTTPSYVPVGQFTFCDAALRAGSACPMLYSPVCATVQIQCVTAPCNPIQQTYASPCEACHNALVAGYSPGACLGDEQKNIVPPTRESFIDCPPRGLGKACTKEYNPVCGKRVLYDNPGPIETLTDYGNPCMACNDGAVNYRFGTCTPQPTLAPAVPPFPGTEGSARPFFSRVGTIVFNNPGMMPDTPYLVYDEPGAPARTIMLLFSTESMFINADGQKTPIVVMSASPDIYLGGRRASVTGELQENGAVIIGTVQVLEEPGSMRPPLGEVRVYEPWERAVALIRACEVREVMQTHALEVTLTKHDGTRVTAMEPVIDDVFAIVRAAEAQCGPLMVATE